MAATARHCQPPGFMKIENCRFADPSSDRRHWIATGWLGLMTAVFMTAGCTTGVAQTTSSADNLTSTAVTDNDSFEGQTALATIAGGCFWCTEAVFERMRGISDVTSGYIGGEMVDPDYKSVCTGRTGHAEAVRITYDPSVVSFKEILKVFFKTHDPTTLNRQGADVGTQYRSAIFPHNDEQKREAEEFIAEISGEYRDPIVTSIEPLSTWYPAEEYHQDYFRRNPNAGYCQAVVANKVRKFNREFGDEYLDKSK